MPRGLSPKSVTSWRESDFEAWFLKHPRLPNGERLVPLVRQQSLRRMVDLLCIDRDGGLVLIEVKNETSSRTAIGQALEYLSQYEDTDLESLLEESDLRGFPATRRRLQQLGIHSLRRKRRVILAAPSFDFPTQAAVSLLNSRFAQADLELGLLEVRLQTGRFTMRLLEAVAPVPIRQLRGRCGITARGRLFYVLPWNNESLVLNLGRLHDGVLHPPAGPTVTQRLVRRRTGSLLPYDGLDLDLTRLGTVWQHVRRPRQATVLAWVQPLPGSEDSPQVYFALEDTGALIGFRRRTADAFVKWYSGPVDQSGDISLQVRSFIQR